MQNPPVRALELQPSSEQGFFARFFVLCVPQNPPVRALVLQPSSEQGFVCFVQNPPDCALDLQSDAEQIGDGNGPFEGLRMFQVAHAVAGAKPRMFQVAPVFDAAGVAGAAGVSNGTLTASALAIIACSVHAEVAVSG